MKKKIYKKAKRILCIALISALAFNMLSLSQFQIGAHSYKGDMSIEVKTSGDKNSGTDQPISFKLYSRGTEKISQQLDGNGNDFEKGDQDTYSYSFENMLDPWMYDKAGFHMGSNITASPDWQLEWATIRTKSPFNGSTITLADKFIRNTWFGKNQEKLTEIDTKRDIRDVSVFTDTFKGDYYVSDNVADTVSIRSKKTMLITDQYGTYNPYQHSDSPTLNVSVMNNGVNYGNYFRLNSGEKEFSYTLDSGNKTAFLDMMRKNNVFDLTPTAKWSFPYAGTDIGRETSSTFNIHRLEYQEEADVGTGKAKPPEKPTGSIAGADQSYYYNTQSKVLQWRIKYLLPKPVFNVWDTMKDGPVVKVYRGNGTSNLIGTAKITRSKMGSNTGYLNCSLTMPDDLTTSGDGISLEVSNTDIITNGQLYTLGLGIGTMWNRHIYFSSYKVDTERPETELVNKNGTPLVLNENKKEQSFYIRSTEPLEKGTAVFTLRKNGSAEQVAFKPLQGSGTNNVYSDTQPITMNALNSAYRLAVAEGQEGYFDLNIKYNDIAKNTGEQTVTKIALDNKAPNTSVSTIPKTPDAEGSKRTDYPFTIQDFQSNARVYYCFVPKDESLDMDGVEDAEETAKDMNADEKKWYFVEKGAATTTASMKVERGDNFEGSLYYYSDDGVGNKTAVKTQAANIYNEESKGSLEIEDETPALSEYVLSFVDLDGSTASYQWVETNEESSGFTMDMTPYDNKNFGTKRQRGADGKDYLFNGSYTLKYEIQNKISGNISKYEKDFVFDNSNPVISMPQWNDGQRVKNEQAAVIRISDLSGLKEATYQITDLDGEPLKGYEDKKALSIDEEGNVKTSIQLSGFDNGVYGLKIYAKDQNDFEKTVWYGGSEGTHDDKDESVWNDVRMTFAIRSLAPTMKWEIKNVDLIDNDRYLTKSNYTIDINVTDKMTSIPAAGFFENFIKYQVSSDGSNWSEWRIVSNNKMQRDKDAFKGVITLDNPIPLHNEDDINTIYVRTACYSSGDAATDITLPKSISEPLKVEIFKDTTGPQGDVTYKQLEMTADDVEVEVQLKDTYTDIEHAELLVRDEDINKITIEKNSENDGSYTVTVKENVDTVLIAKDQLGNTSEIAITVTNIDKMPPVSTGTVTSVQNGDRVDAEAVLNINGMDPFHTKLALAPGANVTSFTQEDYDRFSEYNAKNMIDQTIQDVTLPSGDIDRIQTLRFKGFDGDWTIGISTQDVLGNHQESALASFHVANATPQIKNYYFVPEITKSKTVGTFQFNVPSVVLPDDQITDDEEENLSLISSIGKQSSDEEMSAELKKTFTAKQDIVFYISDSIGNAQKVVASMDGVSFIDGFDIKTTYLKNNEAFTPDADSWIAMTSQDTISAVVEADGKYARQYFYLSSEDSDMVIDEDKSEKTSYVPIVNGEQQELESAVEHSPGEENKIPAELAGKQLYSKLVFNAKHDGKTVKTVRFSSYTEEGNVEDRNQNEVLTISNIDESVPEADIVYSTLQPTNQDVEAVVTAKDAQSGIVKIEEKTNTHGYKTVYENDQALTSVKVESLITSNDDIHTFKITNRAGLTFEKTTSVTNIDKAAIELDKHFSIHYEYQSNNQWIPVETGKAYQKVKAIVSPVAGSGKTLTAKNNQGKFDVLLDQHNAAFDLQLQDQAGNEITQTLSWTDFDTTAPVIEVPQYDPSLTNKEVEVTIQVTDSSKENNGEIKDCQLTLMGMNDIPLEKVSNGIYTGYVPQNGVYLIKAKDYAGNESTQQFTISNIDKTAPVVTKINQSIAKEIITSSSVLVTVESFSKHVQDLRIEPVSGTDLSFVSYSEGSNEIRFLRNGSVNLLFRDDYGNVGSQLITIDNIKSTPPKVEAVVTYADNLLQADISFKASHTEGVMDDDLSKFFITTPLLNAGKQIKLLDTNNNSVKVKIKENGSYTFKISDEAGNTQELNVNVDKIDKTAPKILSVEWEYDYLDPNANWSSALEKGQHLAVDGEKEYKLNSQFVPYTNQDVKVTVNTDKEISQIGSDYGKKAKEASMVYSANGLFSFNLEAVNGTSTFYGVGVDVIDKEKSVITFEAGQELIFVQSTSDPNLMYDKAKLYDFKATDNNNVDISNQVQIDFKNFQPDDINENTFNRNAPYYIVYSVRDKAGNITEVTRTIRLIGLTDTVVLINGQLSAGDVMSVEGDQFQVAIKNFSGKAYVSYMEGSLTMGEMKRGKTHNVQPDSKGTYKIEKLKKGWYTVYVQTDKKDLFNISVYVNP